MDHDKDWDEAVHYVMFAVREEPTESLGFSLKQLIFGPKCWVQSQSSYQESLLNRVVCTWEWLMKALEVVQTQMD